MMKFGLYSIYFAVVSIIASSIAIQANAQSRRILEDGTYVVQSQLCHMSASQRADVYGDRVATMVIHIDGWNIYNDYGTTCRVAGMAVDGNTVSVKLDCDTEGEDFVRQETIRPTGRASFNWNNDKYSLCMGPNPSTDSLAADEDGSRIIELESQGGADR